MIVIGQAESPVFFSIISFPSRKAVLVCILTGLVELLLEVRLRDLQIPESHASILVTQQDCIRAGGLIPQRIISEAQVWRKR